MVRTVNEAFNFFLANYVNLDPEETSLAKHSRNWLISQIHDFPDKDNKFPKLYSEKDIFFGSFARRTKKRELDDIDIMIALDAEKSSYYEFTDRIEIYVPASADKLKALCYENTSILNSRKVINKFISLLEKVPQYEKSVIKRNMEAATLNLTSYTWTFDIVPCFFTVKDQFNRDYYLIPDGNGDWKKTDPRIDRQRVTDINQFHNGNLLNVIRLMKYWNERPTMPSMPSYLIENMVLNYYAVQYQKASQYLDLEIIKILSHIRNAIFLPVNDPKGIQGNINNLSREDKSKIYSRACIDYSKSLEAKNFQEKKDHKLSIEKWREVWGRNFPLYI